MALTNCPLKTFFAQAADVLSVFAIFARQKEIIMKKTLILLVAAMAMCGCTINFDGFSFSGNKVRCGGEVIEKKMDLAGFDEIKLEGAAKVVFAQADSFLVSVKANEEVFDYIDFQVNGNELLLSTKNHVNILAKTYVITVNAPLLKDISVSGAADMDVLDGYKSEQPVNISINGAGDLNLVDIAVPSMTMVINGAADLDLTDSNIPELSVTVNGAGDLDIDNIVADAIDITVRGAGDVSISGKAGEADFRVSGAGSVDAHGLDCENITTAKHGAASIKL